MHKESENALYLTHQVAYNNFPDKIITNPLQILNSGIYFCWYDKEK